MVKRLRRRPLTAETGVRFPMGLPKEAAQKNFARLLSYKLHVFKYAKAPAVLRGRFLKTGGQSLGSDRLFCIV